MLRSGFWYSITLGCAALLYSCSPSDESFSVYKTINNPDGKYEIVIEQAPSSFIPRGPSSIKVYVTELNSGERTCVITTRIANDGMGISSSNIKLKWKNTETLSLCFSGIEQEDHLMEINVVTLEFSEVNDSCVDSN